VTWTDFPRGERHAKLRQNLDVTHGNAPKHGRPFHFRVQFLRPSSREQRKEVSDRAELLAGASPNMGGFRGELSLSNDHRARLTSATDRMAAGSDRLKESRKIARETEMVALDVMEDLRQQVRHLSSNASTGTNTSSSSRTSTSTNRRGDPRVRRTQVSTSALFCNIPILPRVASLCDCS
jgi:hypothetical protein